MIGLWLRSLWHAVRGHRLEMSRLDGEAYECSCDGMIVVRVGNDLPWKASGTTCPVFEWWLVRRRREIDAALPRARSLSPADRKRIGGRG